MHTRPRGGPSREYSSGTLSLAVMERDKKLDSALKQWLDNVLVPVMVREYLAIWRAQGDNDLSPVPSPDTEIETPERVQ